MYCVYCRFRASQIKALLDSATYDMLHPAGQSPMARNDMLKTALHNLMGFQKMVTKQPPRSQIFTKINMHHA